jgi:glycine dehydrogenase subunit 1
VRVPAGTTAAEVLAGLEARRILGGVDLGRWYPELSDCILMCATELTTDGEIDALAAALASIVARETAAVR